MAGAIVRLLGVARLSARLAARRKAMEGELVDAMNKSAAIVTSGAKSLVSVQTGALRNSIHPIPAEKQNGRVTSGASTAMEYAPFVEFGTGVRGDGSYPHQPKDLQLSYGNRAGQTAQPFMYPALHQNKDKIKKLVRVAVMKAVVKGGK